MYNKTNRQGGNIGGWTLALAAVFVVSVMIAWHESRIESLESNDTCIEAMYETGIDVNDDIERSKFLKECIDGK
jgi:hypothetical protein